MKLKVVRRPFVVSSLACLIALSSTDCGKSESKAKSLQVSSEAGAGGEAGSTGQGITVCGKAAPSSECEPLTAAPCNIAGGETCEYDFSRTGFFCYQWPKFSRAGEICGEGYNCGPATTCNINVPACQHYCCSDSECENGMCWVGLFEDGEASAGVCGDEFVDED